MADMAVQCYAGNAARGMSLVALHNGGGVGIEKQLMGFGLVLDGSERADEIIKSALSWDVMGGVARRSWARNEQFIETVLEFNREKTGKRAYYRTVLGNDKTVKRAVKGAYERFDKNNVLSV